MVETVAAWADSKVRMSGICVQLFADRPANGRFRIAMELMGQVPGMDRERSKQVRHAVAEELRDVLRGVDDGLSLRRGAMIASFPVEMPGVVDAESDVDERVAVHRVELELNADVIRSLEEPLATWCEQRLVFLLQRAEGPSAFGSP